MDEEREGKLKVELKGSTTILQYIESNYVYLHVFYGGTACGLTKTLHLEQ